MRVGVMIEGQEGLTWERWLRLIDAAEDMGYESLCRSDHLTSLAGDSKRPSLETWTSLTLVAVLIISKAQQERPERSGHSELARMRSRT